MYLFFQYTEMLRRPLDQITEQLKELQKAAAGIGRVQQLYSTSIEIEDGPGISVPSRRYHIGNDVSLLPVHRNAAPPSGPDNRATKRVTESSRRYRARSTAI